MAVDDPDCDCEMPLDMDDSELEVYSRQSPHLRTNPTTPSRLTGFIGLSRLCRIAGKIVRAVNPLQMQHRTRRGNSPRLSIEQRKRVEALDAELEEWLQTVPDLVQFSAANNNMDYDCGSPPPHLTMCVISYIVHAGCVINLHR